MRCGVWAMLLRSLALGSITARINQLCSNTRALAERQSAVFLYLDFLARNSPLNALVCDAFGSKGVC